MVRQAAGSQRVDSAGLRTREIAIWLIGFEEGAEVGRAALAAR